MNYFCEKFDDRNFIIGLCTTTGFGNIAGQEWRNIIIGSKFSVATGKLRFSLHYHLEPPDNLIVYQAISFRKKLFCYIIYPTRISKLFYVSNTNVQKYAGFEVLRAVGMKFCAFGCKVVCCV
jgi:hypothetical protein